MTTGSFYKKIFILLLILLAGLLVPQKVSAATTVTVGAGQVVVTPAQIYPWTNPLNGTKSPFIDSPINTFTSGGVRYWLNSRGYDHARYTGTLASPFQTTQWNKMTENYFTDPHNLIGGPIRKIDNLNWTFGGGEPWIVNLYQASDRELLAFVHIEQGQIINGSYTHGKGNIGLAWSNNAGESFTYLGHILGYQDPTRAYNMQGAPYFIKDGYFYVYYHDLCPNPTTAVARASVAEVLQAARANKTSSWKKYNQGAWTGDGLTGTCTRPNIAVGIDHTDAMYSTYTKKYYILLSNGGGATANSWINMYESVDAINWTFVKPIVNELPGQLGGYQYVSVVDSTGTDNGVVGKSFYVYSARNPFNASVYRWPVTFTDPPPSPTSTPPTNPTPTGTQKTGDINSDGLVNIIDIGVVIDNYGKTPITNPKADVNRDGLVNIIDIGMIIDNYGK